MIGYIIIALTPIIVAAIVFGCLIMDVRKDRAKEKAKNKELERKKNLLVVGSKWISTLNEDDLHDPFKKGNPPFVYTIIDIKGGYVQYQYGSSKWLSNKNSMQIESFCKYHILQEEV